jgi:hypothetical protein
MLGQVLTLRHVPALEFVIDSSTDYGRHIDDILHNLGLDAVKNESDGQEEEYQEEEYDEAVEERLEQ